MIKYIENYLTNVKDIIDTLDKSALSLVLGAFKKAQLENRRIFVLGNGGSAAHSNHFACDLGKNVTGDESGRFKVISVCENVATITAYANDMDYERIFSEQLKNYCVEEGDIILAVSASGNSPNVIKAVEYAKSRKAVIIALVGFNGGMLKNLADIYLLVNSYEYEKVEDLHLLIMHIIVSYFKDQMSVS
ncbi:MAG: SIS domain-containing protein [Clostridiaceae bacterium]|nr:SIS domain-containing protein [Clostridiaceae bacterium]